VRRVLNITQRLAHLQRDRLDAHAMFERVSEEELAKDPAAGLLYEVGGGV